VPCRRDAEPEAALHSRPDGQANERYGHAFCGVRRAGAGDAGGSTRHARQVGSAGDHSVIPNLRVLQSRFAEGRWTTLQFLSRASQRALVASG